MAPATMASTQKKYPTQIRLTGEKSIPLLRRAGLMTKLCKTQGWCEEEWTMGGNGKQVSIWVIIICLDFVSLVRRRRRERKKDDASLEDRQHDDEGESVKVAQQVVRDSVRAHRSTHALNDGIQTSIRQLVHRHESEDLT